MERTERKETEREEPEKGFNEGRGLHATYTSRSTPYTVDMFFASTSRMTP